MIDSGAWVSPSLNDTPQFTRPLAVLWLQAFSAQIFGSENIWAYRLPSSLGILCAALSLYVFARDTFGRLPSFLAAATQSAFLIVILQGHLAGPEGLLLPCVVVAQLALARMYLATDGKNAQRTALIFWGAQGVGILFNALTLPILSLLTIAALTIADRDAKWLRQLFTLTGLSLMVLISAIWPAAFWMAENIQQVATDWWREIPGALMGPQEMKWRKIPGAFIIFTALAALPFVYLFAPATRYAWRLTADRKVRFLLAWLVPYLIFLELLSWKPPTYMVQSIMPAVALLFGCTVAAAARSPAAPDARPRFGIGLYIWSIATVALGVVLWVWCVYFANSEIALTSGIAGISIALAILAFRANQKRALLCALGSSLISTLALYMLCLQIALPNARHLWPSVLMYEAVTSARTCAPSEPPGISVTGHNEPSAYFLLGKGAVRIYGFADISSERAKHISLAFVEGRWLERFLWYFNRKGSRPAKRIACFKALSWRGCRMHMSLYAMGQPELYDNCQMPAKFRCDRPEPKASLRKSDMLLAKGDKCL